VATAEEDRLNTPPKHLISLASSPGEQVKRVVIFGADEQVSGRGPSD
jgi:hypothetical protein